MFLRIEILAINSALQLIRLVLLLATLSSQMKFRHVATSHAAGSSQDSDVQMFMVMMSLAVRLSTWLERQASRGVATSLLYGQDRTCSNQSSGSSQK